jgi:transcriptional regulator with XRE-family HTH domain
MSGDATRFRQLRRAHRLSLQACAELLGVTGRTVSRWESGRVRVPYAPYRLLRLLLGAALPGRGWEGFRVAGDRLVSAEGHSYTRGDLAWLSLTFRQADGFRALYRQATRQRAEGKDGRFGAVAGTAAAANERVHP